jgi:Heterokaryon incompatibility protein (HET)
LIVDDQELLVTSAVEEFLFQRSAFESKFFWIDAVCINQKDDSEKSGQISLMREIYQRAVRIIIWLAPPENLRDAALVRGAVADDALFKDAGYVTGLGSTSMFMGDQENPIYREIGLLFSNPWFHRKWVIQELAVVSDVHVAYKGTCLSWEDISHMNEEVTGNPGIKLRVDISTGPGLKGTNAGSDSSESSGLMKDQLKGRMQLDRTPKKKRKPRIGSGKKCRMALGSPCRWS